jgi:hypothetical protein
MEVQKFNWVLAENVLQILLFVLAGNLSGQSKGLGLQILPRKGAGEKVKEDI